MNNFVQLPNNNKANERNNKICIFIKYTYAVRHDNTIKIIICIITNFYRIFYSLAFCAWSVCTW